LEAKRLQLLHDLMPKAARIAVLVNPASPATEGAQRGIPDAARALGLQIQVLKASTKSEIEAPFATLARDRADALYVAGDVFFTSRRVQFATLAASYRIPAIYPSREAVEAGGLMGYSTDRVDMWRQVGAYTSSRARSPLTAFFELSIHLRPAYGRLSRAGAGYSSRSRSLTTGGSSSFSSSSSASSSSSSLGSRGGIVSSTMTANL
jgi:hypothetical protein